MNIEKVKYFLIFFILFFLSITSVYAEEGKAKENIGYKIIKKISFENTDGDYHNLFMTEENFFIFITHYKRKDFTIFFYNENLNLLNKKNIDFLEGGFPRTNLLINNNILFQTMRNNKEYKESKDNITNSFHYIKYLVVDKNGSILSKIKLFRMGQVLPPLTEKQKKLFLIGGQIHLVDYMKLTDNYLLEIKPDGSVQQTITMKTKVIDGEIISIWNDEYIPFDESRYIILHMKDILNTTEFLNKRFMDLVDQQDNIGIFIFNVTNKTIECYDTLQSRVRDFITKNEEPDRIILGDKLQIWSRFYLKKENILVFQISRSLVAKTKTQRRVELNEAYICKYDIQKKTLSIIKQPKYLDYFELLGIRDGIFYFWNTKGYPKYDVLGIKFDDI